MADGIYQLKVRLTVKCCLTKISHKNNYKILEGGGGLYLLLLHRTSIIKPCQLRDYVLSSRMRDVKTEGAVMYETLARGIKENNELEHLSQLWRDITRNSNKNVSFWA